MYLNLIEDIIGFFLEIFLICVELFMTDVLQVRNLSILIVSYIDFVEPQDVWIVDTLRLASQIRCYLIAMRKSCMRYFNLNTTGIRRFSTSLHLVSTAACFRYHLESLTNNWILSASVASEYIFGEIEKTLIAMSHAESPRQERHGERIITRQSTRSKRKLLQPESIEDVWIASGWKFPLNQRSHGETYLLVVHGKDENEALGKAIEEIWGPDYVERMNEPESKIEQEIGRMIFIPLAAMFFSGEMAAQDWTIV